MSETPPPFEARSLGVLIPETHLAAVGLSPCGRILAGASFDQRIRRWDWSRVTAAAETEPRDGKKIEIPDAESRRPDVAPGHHGFVSGVVFHPTRLLAVSADTWGGLSAWPYLAEHPEPLWQDAEAHDGWIRDLAMSPDGEWFVTGGRDGKVGIFTTEGGRRLRAHAHHQGEEVFAVAIHPGGDLVASADLRGRVVLFEARTSRIRREFDASDFYLLHRLQDLAGIRRLRFSPGGEYLMVIGTLPTGGANFRGQAQFRLFDVESGAVAFDVPLGEAAKNAIAHDADFLSADLVVSVTTGQSGQGSLFVHRLGEMAPRFELNRGTVNNHGLALSPDRRTLAVAATNTGSNGNGKRLDKEGNYVGNHSPVHVFALPPDLA